MQCRLDYCTCFDSEERERFGDELCINCEYWVGDDFYERETLQEVGFRV